MNVQPNFEKGIVEEIVPTVSVYFLFRLSVVYFLDLEVNLSGYIKET